MAESYKDPFYDKLDAQVTSQLGLPSGLLANIRTKGEKSNASQVSSAGAQSVYQIIPATREAVLKKYGVDAYKSPEDAALAAGYLLKESIGRNKGDVASAVREYHGGTNPANWGKVNQAYVGRVMGKNEQPKGLTQEQIDELISKRKAAQPKTEAKQGLTQEQINELIAKRAPKQRGFIDELGRQAGLTGRAIIEGAADVGGILYDPIAATINAVAPDSAGNIKTLSSQGRQLANTLGLPQAETGTEQLVQQASKALVGAGGTIGAGKAIAGAAPKAAAFLAEAPLTQAVSSAGAATGSELARQEGGGTGAQIASALAGGLAPYAVAGKAATLGKAARTAIPAEQKAVIEAGEAAGVPVMTSDIMPPDTYVSRFAQSVGEKIPFIGTGGNRSAQAQTRVEAIKDVARSYGAHIDTPLDNQIYASLSAKRTADLNKYVGLKNDVIEKVAGAGAVNMRKTQEAIQAEIDDLVKAGIPNTEGAIQNLENWKSAFDGKSFADVEKLRKAFGESLKDDKGAIPSFLDKIPTRVYGAVKSDMDEFLKQVDPALSSRWAFANKRLADGIAEVKGSKLKNILAKGDLTPETVNNLLFSSKPSEVGVLFRNLGESGKENARSAIIKRMIDNAGGMDNLSAEKFRSQFKKLEPQVKVFFDDKSRQQLEGLNRLLDVTQRAGKSNFLAPTGEQLVLPTLGTSAAVGLGFWPALAAASTVGAISRVYESAPVRNLMIKLATAKKNSQQETALAQKLLSIVREQSNSDEKEVNRF
jgi:hypothetical protein